MNGGEGSSVLIGAQLNLTATDKSSMAYETIYTEAPVESSPRENSNQSGTTLKEHDYIGLSEVSSSNSSNGKRSENGRREELNLNLSATELRLGPPAVVKPIRNANGEDQESTTLTSNNLNGNRVPDQAPELERSHAAGKAEGPVAQDVGAVVENPAKRAAYHQEQGNNLAEVREPVAHVQTETESRPEFAKSLLGGLQRSSILQEFRMVQARKAAQDAPHAQMMKTAALNRPMEHGRQDFEAGQKGKYPAGLHASYSGAQNTFLQVKNNGVKRGFSEAVGHNHHAPSGGGGAVREGQCDVSRGDNMVGNEQPDVKVKSQQGKWMAPSYGHKGPAWQNLSIEKANGSHNPFNMRRTLMNKSLQDTSESSIKASNEANKHGINEAMTPAAKESTSIPAPAQQTVGWPPVRSFVRNSNPVRPAPPPSAPATTCASVQGKGASSSTSSNSWFVKIYMDGVPFGRKVDLKTNNSYEKLYPALEEMFQQFISGHYCGSRSSTSGDSHSATLSRKLNFLDGSEYVLIYEDHEGDFMLVGDVPWELFINTVKRLRIMKGSEEVNLAPRSADPLKAQAVVAG